MNKIIAFFAAILVVLLVTQTVLCDDTEHARSDVLYILNPDTIPKILPDLNSPLAKSDQRRRVCTASSCQRVCRALNFRSGRCNANKVCMCSRS